MQLFVHTCLCLFVEERKKDRQTDRQTDRKTERQTDRDTVKKTSREAGRQTDKQTDKQTDLGESARDTNHVELIRDHAIRHSLVSHEYSNQRVLKGSARASRTVIPIGGWREGIRERERGLVGICWSRCSRQF